MTWFWVGFLTISIPMYAWMLIWLHRSHRVSRFRIHSRNQMFDATQADIQYCVEHDIHFTPEMADWREIVFRSVSTRQMVRQFWRPLRSFYPDMSFTRPMYEQTEQVQD